ncbi:MAG: exodeoxyribonuclease VII small subunit [Erysipelotrichaceae bacterium]|nr:exodeoxyribonuclease VII small subunit [Erysipelotrichaceae bacterium]
MDKQLTFEEAMQKLEQINLQLQQSNTSLTKSIELYQQGLSLANYCKQQLLSATKKIEELNKENSDDQ